ncbi:MAG: metallophosphoesterase [Candidatus Hodarchaeota archaeon]
MRILLSADFHGDFSRLLSLATKADLCICCGDLFDYRQLPTRDFRFPMPFYCVKGNKELWGGEKLQNALESCHNFFWLNQCQEDLEELTGLQFYGIDYMNEPLTIPDSLDVLISHQPAFGIADQCRDPFRAKSINHCGSQAVRKLVDQHNPKFLIAGHVHAYQKQRAGKTFATTLSPALKHPLAMIIKNELVIGYHLQQIFVDKA